MGTLFFLAVLGAAIGALVGAVISNDGAFLGGTAGLIVSVLLWTMGFMVMEHTAPARLDDDWGLD